MNIGLYQSASALSALERWQDTVSQNITSSQQTGYRKRTISFSTQSAGEIHTDPKSRHGDSVPVIFPRINGGISFITGETQPTRRELDVAIQGDGFFELQLPDGGRAYTRSGEFRMRLDHTLVDSSGNEVLSSSGSPIQLLSSGAAVTINRDGTIFQGETSLGRLSVQRFADTTQLRPIAGGYFTTADGVKPEAVEEPELLQGYLEGSNASPLREMVDLVLISRAYEANQKIINTVDQQMQKTLEALG